MSITHDWRGRHRQAARNLTIAVASAALAGGGMAIASDDGSGAGGAHCPKQTWKAGPPGSGGPSKNDPLMSEARARLDALVTKGTIEQSEADAVLRSVLAGSVDVGELIRSGKVSAAHMPAINDELRAVKEAHAPPNDEAKEAAKAERQG